MVKDSGNLEISNSFGNLATDMVDPEIREEVVFSEENKENEIIGRNKNDAKSVAQVKSVVFGAGSKKSSGEVQIGKNDKWARQTRPTGTNIQKPKFVKGNRPGRGLMFGPIREDNAMSSSGKRLRVERENVGRPGGVFTAEQGEGQSNEQMATSQVGEDELAMVCLTEIPNSEVEMTKLDLAFIQSESKTA